MKNGFTKIISANLYVQVMAITYQSRPIDSKAKSFRSQDSARNLEGPVAWCIAICWNLVKKLIVIATYNLWSMWTSHSRRYDKVILLQHDNVPSHKAHQAKNYGTYYRTSYALQTFSRPTINFSHQCYTHLFVKFANFEEIRKWQWIVLLKEPDYYKISCNMQPAYFFYN